MPDPDGGSNYYVIKENRTDFVNVQNNVLTPLFEFKQNPRQRQGKAVDLTIDQKPQKIMGRKEYWNGREVDVYYPAVRGSNGQYQPVLDDPYMRNGRLMTSEDFEDLILTPEDVRSTFPSKKASDLENELERQ